ncbi:cobyric acid synthase [Nocardioides sp. KR10-350]|uniref:cobyric acid synthase n=1 Tax=Nocardioides cheoyonin TaxID=3156615 RepID=UPI0032B395E7
MSGLLVAGTTSDAGKSVVTTGLCRAFARRGVRVAPYKAQNMSNNSMVCAGGFETVASATSSTTGSTSASATSSTTGSTSASATSSTTGSTSAGATSSTTGSTSAGATSSTTGYAEIGRAQWVQALAAGVRPEPAMNPVLLKPGSDRRSHVVLMGQPGGEVSAGDWAAGRRPLAAAAHAAYDDLAGRFEVVVAEGAGSPAEINLRAGDYVNLGLARHAGLPTVVVGDIDRGGVFAAMYGTVALLEPADQALVAGFVVNRFRGDAGLLAPGLRSLERLTGRPVYGVLPWHPGLWLDSEDALDLDGRRSRGEAAARVAVVRLPRISNFTDVDALGLEPDLDVVFASRPGDLGDADLVVLPGTRATVADLAWLRSRGLDAAIHDHAARGGAVLGICGGCQMLGREIADPEGVEGAPGTRVEGLGLLDLATTFAAEKTLRLHEPAGYEIHHGRVRGETRRGAVTGTMVHGLLEDDAHRSEYLREALGVVSRVSFPAARERRLDLLGDLVEEHLDVDALLALARDGAPAGLPVLPPAGGGGWTP